MEVMADTKSTDVVAEDEKNKTTDRIEKLRIQSNFDHYPKQTTSERISNEGKRSDDEMEISAPPEDVKY